jgi:predicted transposase YbfD/YdcC
LQAQWNAGIESTTQRCKGHGRIETRTLTTTTWLNDYLVDWPGVRQVFRLERSRTHQGKTSTEVVYGITSLDRTQAGPDRLLELTRAHWAIENGLHHTRDETFREDRCRVRRGHAAQVLASLRNVALHLLRTTNHPSVPAATRHLAAIPQQALDLLDS